ncbi:MAG: hypothetical protein MK137_06035 [Rickettsiales bacterium]|nr:hypothetical protein [Rickettsiales bacterium]
MTFDGGVFDQTVLDAPNDYVGEMYYYPILTAGNLDTKTITAGRAYYLGPFQAEADANINRLGIEVTTASLTAGDKAILGIYKVRNGIPHELVGTNNGLVDIDTVGVVEAVVDINIKQGEWYFMVMLFQSACSVAAFADSNNVRNFGDAYDSRTTLIKDSIPYVSELPAISAVQVGDYTAEKAPFGWFRSGV